MINQNTGSGVSYNRYERENDQVSISIVSPVIVRIKSNRNGFIRAKMGISSKLKEKLMKTKVRSTNLDVTDSTGRGE